MNMSFELDLRPLLLCSGIIRLRSLLDVMFMTRERKKKHSERDNILNMIRRCAIAAADAAFTLFLHQLFSHFSVRLVIIFLGVCACGFSCAC